MFRDFKYIAVGAVLFLLMGVAAGWLIGSAAGSYLDGFHFAGVQGKEATRYFGAVFIGILGSLLGANFGKLQAKRHRK